MVTTSKEPTTTAASAAGERAPARNGLIEALSQPNFRWYWFGLLGVTFSVDMLRFAFPWLAYHLTGSPLAVGLVAFAFGVPNLVLAPFGGVLADRVGRGPIIRTTQALEVLLSVVLAGVLLVGVTDIWVIALLAALIGAVLAFDQPARQAMVPALVPRAVLMNAVALVSTAWSLARIAGPALGGLLLALFLANGTGPGALFLIVAVGFVLMFLCMWRVDVPATPAPVRAQSVLRDMAEGFLFIGRQPKVLALFIVVAVGSTFGQSFTVLMPVIALEVYGVDERGLGLLVACVGIGGLIGTVTLAVFAGYFRRRGALLLGGIGLYGALLVLFSQSSSMLVSVPILALVGVFQVWYLTSAQTLVQVLIPDELRGRVMATYTFTWSLIPVGGAIMGALAALLGPTPPPSPSAAPSCSSAPPPVPSSSPTSAASVSRHLVSRADPTGIARSHRRRSTSPVRPAGRHREYPPVHPTTVRSRPSPPRNRLRI